MNQSILYFLLGCIPVRILISCVPYLIDKEYLPYYGAILLIMGINFLILYFFNLRLNAPEAGGKTWWTNLRLFHGLLYICAAIYSLNMDKMASVPLGIDVVIGLIAFIHHHNFLNF